MTYILLYNQGILHDFNKEKQKEARNMVHDYICERIKMKRTVHFYKLHMGLLHKKLRGLTWQ